MTRATSISVFFRPDTSLIIIWIVMTLKIVKVSVFAWGLMTIIEYDTPIEWRLPFLGRKYPDLETHIL